MSYIFGGNTPWSYEDIQRKRKIADQLVAQNATTPRNVGEGIASIGRALAGRAIEKRASRRDSELKEQFNEQLGGLFGGLGSGVLEASGSAPPSNDQFGMSAIRDAFASVESAGSGDYRAVGPKTAKGRAYGRYQVMDFNIPNWTQAVLGRAYTPEEFLADDRAQDAVFDAKMQEYMGKHGSVEDAASIWFSGRPMKEAGNASDGYNTVPQYVSKITNALGGGGGGRSFDPAMLAQLASNPYADAGQKKILEALLGQQMQTLDPRYQMGLEKDRLGIEQAQLNLDQDRSGGGNENEYGLTPQYITDADGNLKMIQLGKDGTINEVKLPEGAAIQKGLDKIDMGTHYQWYDTYNRRPVGEPFSKNIAEAKGQEEGAKAAMDAGVSAWESYGKLNTSLANIDEAISALDSGAKSGIVYNMLPNVTLASASLGNAMQRMGLDVIGAVTFGALSEGEMRLAMSTAVPQNLEPPELRAWLVKRRAAQESVAVMMANAAQFLTTPGNTINGWIEQNKKAEKKAPELTPAAISSMTKEQLDQALGAIPDASKLPTELRKAFIARAQQLAGQ